jgi:hypothetical protein
MNASKTLIRWAGCFGCVLVCAALPCRAGSYHSGMYGYSITLPADWKQIPGEELASLTERLQNPDAPHRVWFDVAFQPATNERWFQCPYLLMEVMRYADFGGPGQLNEDQFSQVVDAMTGANLSKSMDQHLSPQARAMLSGISVGEPELDTANRRYHVQITMNVTGIGPVRGELTGYFGREGVVQVMFYSKEADADQFADIGKSITDSFAFDPDKAYSEEEALAHPTHRSLFAGVSNTTLLAVVVGAAAALVIFALQKSQAR